MAYGDRRRPSLYAVHQTLSLSCSLHVVQSQSAELPATSEGGVAQTPLLARTQGRTADCTFNCSPPRTVAGVCLAPGFRTPVVGSAHEGLLPRHAQSKVSRRHADWDER